MHVLRAEKGYVIVGQETDGTVTLADLGLDWAIGKAKADFVGKRSLALAEPAREGRKQLVGLLTEDPDRRARGGRAGDGDGDAADRLQRARPCHLVLPERDARPVDRARAGGRRTGARGRKAVRLDRGRGCRSDRDGALLLRPGRKAPPWLIPG